MEATGPNVCATTAAIWPTGADQIDKHADIEKLIARVALGDRDAFSMLYDQTSGKLFAVCFRVLKQRTIAEDAMQDAYIKVWANAGKYQQNGFSPMSWLVTIARNTAIDRLRASRPDRDISDFEERLSATGPTPEQAAIASSDYARIQGCLDELDPERRDALKGAYLEGESYKDLAGRFDVPLNTMRTWLRRGLVQLRECFSR